MGAYNYVYVGIYLEVENNTSVRFETYYEDDNGNEQKSKFNPNTGKEYNSMVREVKDITYASPFEIEVDGFDEDEFFAPEYSGAPDNCRTWIGNGQDFTVNSGSDLFNLDLGFIDSNKLMNEFINKYKVYLDELGNKFKYEVKFGVVYYAH